MSPMMITAQYGLPEWRTSESPRNSYDDEEIADEQLMNEMEIPRRRLTR